MKTASASLFIFLALVIWRLHEACASARRETAQWQTVAAEYREEVIIWRTLHKLHLETDEEEQAPAVHSGF